jgi:hypothetical protein
MQPDDLAILALLTSLERELGEVEAALPERPGTDSESETLNRLYTEVIGLIPYELAPAAPPPALKLRLMAIVAGDETQDVEPLVAGIAKTKATDAADAANADVAARPAPAGRSTATPVTGTRAPMPAMPATSATSAATPAPPSAAFPAAPAPPRGAPVRRPSRWPLALAAALILALLGLSGFLYRGLQQQGETIGKLIRERDQLIAQEREHAQAKSASEAELTRMQGEMADLQSRLAFITTPGVEISPLHPTGRVPMPADAFGMLFVAADHQHWHLALRGLNPSGAGRQYQLWFVAPQGAVSGGSFTAAPGEPIHLSSAHMPAGTRAVIITLEPEAGTDSPTGPEVLRAAAPVKVL